MCLCVGVYVFLSVCSDGCVSLSVCAGNGVPLSVLRGGVSLLVRGVSGVFIYLFVRGSVCFACCAVRGCVSLCLFVLRGVCFSVWLWKESVPLSVCARG